MPSSQRSSEDAETADFLMEAMAVTRHWKPILKTQNSKPGIVYLGKIFSKSEDDVFRPTLKC